MIMPFRNFAHVGIQPRFSAEFAFNLVKIKLSDDAAL
jgi:hypothetical protein